MLLLHLKIHHCWAGDAEKNLSCCDIITVVADKQKCLTSAAELMSMLLMTQNWDTGMKGLRQQAKDMGEGGVSANNWLKRFYLFPLSLTVTSLIRFQKPDQGS